MTVRQAILIQLKNLIFDFQLFQSISELAKSKIMCQLRIRMTMEEVISTVSSMNLDQCKELLKKELEWREFVFVWLGVSKEDYERVVNKFDDPDFFTLAKALEKGKYIDIKVYE